MEIGPVDVEKNQFVAVRRDTGDKIIEKRPTATGYVKQLLNEIQSNLFNK